MPSKKGLKQIWIRAAPALVGAGCGIADLCKRALLLLGLYLDDLLFLAGGICFVRAADGLAGRDWAAAVAGVCLVAYALVVARSRGGERK